MALGMALSLSLSFSIGLFVALLILLPLLTLLLADLTLLTDLALLTLLTDLSLLALLSDLMQMFGPAIQVTNLPIALSIISLFFDFMVISAIRVKLVNFSDSHSLAVFNTSVLSDRLRSLENVGTI